MSKESCLFHIERLHRKKIRIPIWFIMIPGNKDPSAMFSDDGQKYIAPLGRQEH